MNTPNFNEKPVSATQWERTCAIRIENTYGQMPSAMTVEEIITVQDGVKVSSVPNGNLCLIFDPENADDMFVYNHLNVKVVAAREARDAAQI